MPVTWSDETLILLYIAPVGVQTHDLPYTVASNMVKVSHAPNHSATAAVLWVCNVLPVTVSNIFTPGMKADTLAVIG